jgi:hypothetical protein
MRRTHTFEITITMDRECTVEHALRELRDTIHGEFYPTQRDDTEPGKFWVQSIRNPHRER